MTTRRDREAEPVERHVGLLYRDWAELETEIASLAADRLGGRHAVLVVTRDRAESLSRVAATERPEVLVWPFQSFDRRSALALVTRALDEPRSGGASRTSIVLAHDTRSLAEPAQRELVAFESDLGRLVTGRRDAIILCAYDLGSAPEPVVGGVLEAHPMVVMAGFPITRAGAFLPVAPRSTAPSPRDRIIAAAHEQLHANGIHATGVDSVIEAAGVARATFYRHFQGKDGLVTAWLSDTRPRWFDRVRRRVEARQPSDGSIVPALFAEVASWLEEDGFKGCPFMNSAIELGDRSHPAHAVIRAYLDEITAYVAETVGSDGYDNPAGLAREILVLLEGSIALAVQCRDVTPVTAAGHAATRLLERPL